MFVDRAQIIVRSGRGGDGCVAFRREKYVPRGGPDGGDGGCGGTVTLRASHQLATLLDVARRASYRAEDGRPGGGKNRTGRSGADLVIEVPCGTLVRRADDGVLLGDLAADGAELVVARGGRGGRGNRSFATATHQTPRECEPGEPGEEIRLDLELKLIADVGLVGLPNAGKSTLLSRVSSARPKVAEYPFTTLSPHLGIAELDLERRLVIADLPGLIEGAHLGVGLGIEFLKHIERTRVLVHLVAAGGGDADALARDYGAIVAELQAYSHELDRKPRLVCLSKSDLLPPEEAERLARGLSDRIGAPVRTISGVTGAGLRDLLERLWAGVRRARDGAA
ncbi:MAG: GTPase ObgE [Planctomycetes bacterium]|nr:GTPase ObgE [Planctomycetota bacterium]